LFVVVFPLLVLFLAFLAFAWKTATENASQSTLALARLESREIRELIEDAQMLADRMAQRPRVQAAKIGDCDPILADALQFHRHLEFIAVADVRGQVVCSTVSPANGHLPNVSDDATFRAALTDSAP